MLLIENDADLNKIVAELQRESVIGVDLEADSMFHYQEKVCLLQISTHTLHIVVDPLSVQDLSPLAPVFADARIRKVFHGGAFGGRSETFAADLCAVILSKQTRKPVKICFTREDTFILRQKHP